jgi:hypothetical protein
MRTQRDRVDYCLACGDKFAAVGRSKICGLCRARRIAVDQLAHEVMMMKQTIHEMQRVIDALIEKSRIPDTNGTAIERAPQR